MYTNSILAVTGALVAAVAAVPRAEFQHQHLHHQHHAKRDISWVTEYQTVWETIPVTKTVWVKPGAPSSEAAANTPAPAQVSPVAAAYVAPAPVSSEAAAAAVAPSSSYVAPAYIAPTADAAPAYVAPSQEAAAAPASTYVAPAPYVAPQASSAAAPAPAASSAAPSYDSGSGSGSSGGGQTYTGDLTNYEVGLGACGVNSVSTDHVVAISHVLFDAVSTGNPNTNPLCGKTVYITGANGNTYPATIVDRCPGCDEGSLDLPLPYFNDVTNYADGRAHNMKWTMG